MRERGSGAETARGCLLDCSQAYRTRLDTRVEDGLSDDPKASVARVGQTAWLDRCAAFFIGRRDRGHSQGRAPEPTAPVSAILDRALLARVYIDRAVAPIHVRSARPQDPEPFEECQPWCKAAVTIGRIGYAGSHAISEAKCGDRVAGGLGETTWTSRPAAGSVAVARQLAQPLDAAAAHVATPMLASAICAGIGTAQSLPTTRRWQRRRDSRRFDDRGPASRAWHTVRTAPSRLAPDVAVRRASTIRLRTSSAGARLPLWMTAQRCPRGGFSRDDR